MTTIADILGSKAARKRLAEIAKRRSENALHFYRLIGDPEWQDDWGNATTEQVAAVKPNLNERGRAAG